MLTLRRRYNEEVAIILPDGRHVYVKALRATTNDKHEVRLRFDAPDDIRIVRYELLTDGDPEMPGPF